ncbi:carbohydrate-binding module family 42 [Lecanosticta acicola]|uniref:Alpha-L-arabinofuranosidase n=1 Tax=Lecanosticta acicola TaxID=111012 RepID=A0AAI8Z6M5_9PEZI|nr:carbohydrate-binding module family 42 [Lecanosticta acicola]
MFTQSNLLAKSGLFATLATLATAGPCDIYASGNTPCVAAHSPVRALYDNYSGRLYQVKRGSDNTTTDVGTLKAGGVANAATQDNFCSSTTCLISIIYDQSGRNNHLTAAPPGSAASGPDGPGQPDDLTLATGAPIMVGGNKAYGVFIQPGSGYRIDNTSGVAHGDDPEGMYAIVDGTHYNSHCCFDYGNAESDNTDTGASDDGAMEAIYFGGGDGSASSGSGSGPWIMADLENGLFSGVNAGNNQNDPTITNRFTTAIVKGRPHNWAIRGGDATTGALSTFYNGSRPNPDGNNDYDPMKKQGSIILGIGGDNSNAAQGTFYEGVVTSGFPSDATENLVQQNIVAAKYSTTALTTGPAVNVGSSISFRVTTPGYTNRYIAHTSDVVNTQVVSSSSSSQLKGAASWIVRTGLGNSQCVSFESKDTSGSYMRHRNSQLHVDKDDGTKLMHEDATFCPEAGLNGQGNSIRSWSYATRWMRHYNAVGYVASNGGPNPFDTPVSYNNDVSFVIGNSFA